MTDETPHIPETLAQYLTENQDPQQVERIYDKVSQLLTRGEQVIYIAVQKALTYDPTPEIVVLTNRRFMHYRQNLMGSAQFTDYIWRELKEAKLEEGVMRATLTLFAANGETLRIDNLVKEQARRLYAIAQEMEENVREELRLRAMEEKRAEAGGVYLPGMMGAVGAGSTAAPADEPLQALSKLKQLMEAGLITAEEFETKKKEILARL
ncbi:MAG: PH domain-containing protein [Candidatus Promineofilum sp.]|jgi:cell division protein FtsL|nr:PH domain-containing protein [Promineifilum sp.]